MRKPRILIEVWVTESGIVTVCTNTGSGGTRLCGIKLHASGSTKVAEFWLDREAVDALCEDFAEVEEDGS